MVVIGSLAVAVLLAAQKRCIFCGDRSAPVIDHVRPVHAGGHSVPVNLVVLCDWHNMVKSCYWPGHGYHPLAGHDDAELARMVLFCELDWLDGHHGCGEVDDYLFGSAGRPGTWIWKEPAAGAWLAAWE